MTTSGLGGDPAIARRTASRIAESSGSRPTILSGNAPGAGWNGFN